MSVCYSYSMFFLAWQDNQLVKEFVALWPPQHCLQLKDISTGISVTGSWTV